MIRYKHIELEWNMGSIHGLTNDAIKVAQAHNCKVTFPYLVHCVDEVTL